MLERILLSVETMLYEKEVSLEQQIETDISVDGNLDKTEQVIQILLDNACKYTNTGGTIEVCLRRQRKYAVLVVSNTGEGIAPEHMDKIFDRFYRADESRKHNGSYGLGLPIAKALVEQMGATLSVSSVPHQKTTFSIRWELI